MSLSYHRYLTSSRHDVIQIPFLLLFHVSSRLAVAFFCFSALAGCVAALAIPVAGIANLAHKSGTMTVELKGNNDPIPVFRAASVKNGGTVPTSSADFARAEFSNKDIKIEAQKIGEGRVRIRTSSLSNAGRTYEFEDGITNITTDVVDFMMLQGFEVVSSRRDRAF